MTWPAIVYFCHTACYCEGIKSGALPQGLLEKERRGLAEIGSWMVLVDSALPCEDFRNIRGLFQQPVRASRNDELGASPPCVFLLPVAAIAVQ